MAIRLYQQFWKKNKLSKFSQLLNASSRITFWTLHVRVNFGFAYLMCPSVSGPKALINVSAICHFSEKLQNIFDIGLIRYGVFVQKSLSLKNYFRRNNSQTRFCCLCVNLPTVKIWGQSDKFPMSFSFLQCPLQVKKLIRGNSAKYVNQTGNFYFRPKLKTAISLPIFNLFQWFLF